MSSFEFKILSGGKFDFIEDINVRNAIDEAGRRNIVFVEGYDDKIIFEIIFNPFLQQVNFIDVSVKGNAYGGCIHVSKLLKKCVENFPDEKCFFGIIDRDFRTDSDYYDESNNPEYDNRLFIFFDRYTLENYFIDESIITTFLKDESINDKKIIGFLKENNIKDIIDQVLKDLIPISAANWTLLKSGKSFLKFKTPVDESEILKIISSNGLLNESQEFTLDEYNRLKEIIIQDENDTQKYISGKYFFFHFSQRFKSIYKNYLNGKRAHDFRFDNSYSHFARILNFRDHEDFIRLKQLITL